MKLSRISQLAGFYSCLALPLFMVGCKSTDDPIEQNPPIDFSGPIAPATYSAMVGDASFQRMRSETFATGYTVESGNLLGRDKSIGTLVLVRARSGEVTGIVDRPGKQGSFHVGINGRLRFTEAESVDYKNMKDDAPPASPYEMTVERTPPKQDRAEQEYIDVLAGYSRYALEKIAEDPIAYAYAMLETANLNIGNSDAGKTRLRLAGVRVHEVDFDTSGAGLGKWNSFLSPLRPQYHYDVIMAFGDWAPGIAGMAYVPGYASVNAWGAPTAFRHEFAHNVGGNHCNVEQIDDYKFGFDNGKSATALCNNSVPYYSNPSKRDAHGLPLGNSRTADMARHFRDRTEAMAAYQQMFNGERLFLVALNKKVQATLTIPLKGQFSGVVVLDPSIGPTALMANSAGGYTSLNVPLQDDRGNTVNVRLRGSRVLGTCSSRQMNESTNCPVEASNMYFQLSFEPGDNPTLPAGLYNGTLEMKALDAQTPPPVWSPRIFASITVQKK